MAQLSDDEVKEVQCVHCGASIGQPCLEKKLGEKFIHTALLGFHPERIMLRQQMPIYNCPLDSTDKAIIIAYAFVMMANSCSANSVILFGKPYTTEEIQRTFCQSAMIAAIEDGLIGPIDVKDTKSC